MSVILDTKYTEAFITRADMDAVKVKALSAADLLSSGKGAGNDFLGWLRLPENYDREEFERIKRAASEIRNNSEILIVIGIGGSYLGARAAIEFCTSANYNQFGKPKIFFAGNTISPSALAEIVNLCKIADFSINVVSKSGTTTEPMLAFRILKELAQERYGIKGAAKRIYATTDKSKGSLKELAQREGYETFVIPDDVGGRYSVLTACGLLPIAVAGIDIDRMMAGAFDTMKELENNDFDKNDCYRYAGLRNILYDKGKSIEMMIAYEPDYAMMNEWFKQLFGESEGKNSKGLFPSSAIFSTDLHSLGQYIQEGRRLLFETSVVFDSPKKDLVIGYDTENADGLNFMAGKTLDYVNKKAFQGTLLAHFDGSVPNIVLRLPRMDEYGFGGLVYFLQKACAVSGYMLGINPFDQSGVESYKKNMFALLGKNGYEELKLKLESRIN
ncbi:MAG TPA: glucose-6-phosphate isomerase [Clostridiales bacterium]|nr:glucose-6-phosphate isomerase [Clostridiales bacterium]